MHLLYGFRSLLQRKIFKSVCKMTASFNLQTQCVQLTPLAIEGHNSEHILIKIQEPAIESTSECYPQAVPEDFHKSLAVWEAMQIFYQGN